MPKFMIKMLVFILKASFVYNVMLICGIVLALFLVILTTWFFLRRKTGFWQAGGFRTIISRILTFFWNWKLLFIAPVFSVFLLSIAGMIVPSPRVIYPASPAFGVTDVTNIKPLRLEFDRPINSRKVDIKITPAIKGHWTIARGKYMFFKSKLLFYPESTLPEESVFTVSVSNINNLISHNNSKQYLFSFNTPPAAIVKSVDPKDKQIDVDINQPIKVILNRDDQFKNKWQFVLTPDTLVDVSTKGNAYTIKPKDPLKKGILYTLIVTRTPIIYNYQTKKSSALGEPQQAYSGTFTTVASPTIKSSSPSGSGVLTNTSIKIEFRQNMNQESVEKAWSLGPTAEGKFSWSGTTLSFTPSQPLQKNTPYKITINKNASSTFGTTFDEDYSFTFTTIGYVTVSGFTPGSGATNVNLDQATAVTFNQSVDHASAESKFSISPTLAGSFSWSGNKMSFSHPSLAYSQSYTLKIDTGVKSIDGLDSNQVFSSTFTTKQQSVSLNVPAYKQSHMYSCYATAARSALAYKKVSVSENTILAKIGYDTTPWSGSWNEPGSTWGDPNKGTVGSVDGKANNIGWGYGAYWGPVASAINQLGRPAEVKTGWSVQGIAQEISAGNPVIVWWVNGVWPAYEVFWYNNGNKIRAVNSLHVQVVKGFTGSVENPTSFSVTDSGYGYPGKTFDVGTFKAKWNWFNNSGIVVR